MGEKGNDDPGLLAALQASSPDLANKALEIYTSYQQARLTKAVRDEAITGSESDEPQGV